MEDDTKRIAYVALAQGTPEEVARSLTGACERAGFEAVTGPLRRLEDADVVLLQLGSLALDPLVMLALGYAVGTAKPALGLHDPARDPPLPVEISNILHTVPTVKHAEEAMVALHRVMTPQAEAGR